MMRLTIDETALTALAERVGATERQIDAARDKALRRTEKRIATEVRRQAAKDLRMPQRGIARRVYRGDRFRQGPDSLRVWVGARPISPFRLGSPKPYGQPGKTGGVKVGRRDFPGAFLGAVYGYERVWIRLRSKHYSPDLYPTIRRRGDRGKARDSRFPVVRAAVAIDAILAKVVERQQAVLVAAFTEEFGKQLRDQVARGGGR